MRDCVAKQRHCFIVVHSTHQNRIHFHGQQARIFGCFNAGDHVMKAITVRHLLETLRDERVQADVDPLHSGVSQLLGHLRQPQPIRGERDLGRMRKGVNASDHVHYVWTKKWLTAGQSNLLDTKFGRHIKHKQQLIGGEELITRNPIGEVGGHAVVATKRTPVGQRDAHIAMDATICIDERFVLVTHAQFTHSSVPSSNS